MMKYFFIITGIATALVIFLYSVVAGMQCIDANEDYEECQILGEVLNKDVRLVGTYCVYRNENGDLERVFV